MSEDRPKRPIHPVRRELFERQETLVELARVTGYSVGTLSNVIGGRMITWPKLRAAVSNALGKPESVLFPEEHR